MAKTRLPTTEPRSPLASAGVDYAKTAFVLIAVAVAVALLWAQFDAVASFVFDGIGE